MLISRSAAPVASLAQSCCSVLLQGTAAFATSAHAGQPGAANIPESPSSNSSTHASQGSQGSQHPAAFPQPQRDTVDFGKRVHMVLSWLQICFWVFKGRQLSSTNLLECWSLQYPRLPPTPLPPAHTLLRQASRQWLVMRRSPWCARCSAA
jgi:hypothetical protein